MATMEEACVSVKTENNKTQICVQRYRRLLSVKIIIF